MVKVAVFASGTGSNFENLVTFEKSNKECNYYVQLLIVDKEGAKVIEKAHKLNIETYCINPKDFENKAKYEEKILEILLFHKIELIALAGYMRILTDVILRNYPNKILNIHPSILPAYPGKNSIHDAFINKAEYTGVTIHYVDSGIDTGKIIAQEKLDINPLWSIEDLEEKIHEIEHKLYPLVLNEICNKR
ncbi:MAG: phosphoribosylglycinamide formyltransferase [Fusobacteriaceae bacterium]